MRKTRLFTLWLIFITANAGCATGISRDALLKQMQEGTAPFIVDVRSQGEYNRDHIPGAVHISFYSIRSGLKEAGVVSQDPVVLYCEHGPRAGIAGFLLFLAGYERVFSLDGAMKGWRKSDYPLEKLIQPDSVSIQTATPEQH